MKTPIAITLILAGALLILAPSLFNAWHESALLSALAARPDLHSLSLSNGDALGSATQFGCWSVGLLMILTAIIGSWQSAATAKTRATAEAGLAPHVA